MLFDPVSLCPQQTTVVALALTTLNIDFSLKHLKYGKAAFKVDTKHQEILVDLLND